MEENFTKVIKKLKKKKKTQTEILEMKELITWAGAGGQQEAAAAGKTTIRANHLRKMDEVHTTTYRDT